MQEDGGRREEAHMKPFAIVRPRSLLNRLLSTYCFVPAL
jgi:hypothetical protein